jgi:uncharacterized protein (TIGR00251 family)
MSELPPFARASAVGLELRLKVVPGASHSEIVGPLGDRLKVRVSPPPEGGKANRAVVELISRWLSAADVRIVRGHSSAEKTLEVRGLSTLPSDTLGHRR